LGCRLTGHSPAPWRGKWSEPWGKSRDRQRCSGGLRVGRPVSHGLEAAFRDTIIGGPGSFVIIADGPLSFAEPVRKKLILEIAGGAPQLAAAE